MSTQTEFDKELFELIQFDSNQHDKTCGVTITKDFGNCDCNKVELREAIKATVDKYVIGKDGQMSVYEKVETQCGFSSHQNQLRAKQRIALWGDK